MKFRENILASKNKHSPTLMNFRQKNSIFRLISFFLFSATLISCQSLHHRVSEYAPNEYQSYIRQGWEYLNQRKHSRALLEFTAAGVIRPEQSEPVYGRAGALFYMDRFEEVLEACSDFSGKAENFKALGFCWGARIEISRGATETKKAVTAEIEKFLGRSAPSAELLYSAYQGYYYLKNKEKRLALIMRLADEGADSILAARIASALFEEIISADSNHDQKKTLAVSYIRNFPDGRMADKIASMVLQDLLKEQETRGNLWQVAQAVLKGLETSPLINSAVSLWLIEHGSGYNHAIRLLQKNLNALDSRRQNPPPHFEESLWAAEIAKNRLYYKYLMARAWLGEGELVKARKLLEDILGEEKNWAGVYHFLGMIAIREGRPDQAIQYLASSLAKGSARQETIKELRLLLNEHNGFEGEPLAYFQARRKGVRFRDVTEEVGLSGIKAARVAWGDYDHDDDNDLLLDGSRLFNNRLNEGFVEMDQLIPAGRGGANGGVWGDYDNDHFLDIFVTSHRGNYLLHNDAGVRFSKTDALSFKSGRAASTEAAAWGDVNNDGYLDLYVANYEHGTVMRGQCSQDQLLVNQGGTSFKETEYGLVSEEAMCGRGVTWSDLNGDGRQDILVSNYRLDPNFLWLNQANGSFVDVAESAGVQGHEVAGDYGHSLGSVSGDLDGDGDFDLFISNLAHPRYLEYSDKSMVLINNGDRMPVFADRFRQAGLGFDETSADPLLFDVDYDGDLDLYITSVYRNRTSHLYINDGRGGFTDQTWLSGAGVMNGWGAASADYDGDGYLDLLVASTEGVRLLHNEGGSHNWLAIRIDDHNCNRYGVGSKVTVNYSRQSQIRELTAGRGSGNQDSLTVSFGLGNYTGPVSVQVHTLCGDIIKRHITELNRIVIIENTRKKP